MRLPQKRRSKSSPPYGQRGAVLTEATIALPVMILFLYGVIQYGLILAARIALENAASVVARVALVEPGADFDVVVQDALSGSLYGGQLNLPVGMTSVTVDGGNATKFDIEYRMPVLLGFLVPNAVNGELLLRASSVTPSM